MQARKVLLYGLCGGLILLGLGVGVLPLRAQVLQGTITGHVSDASGAAIAGVEITITNEQTGVAIKTLSTQAGVYVVPELQAGSYAIAATKAGFSRLDIRGVRLLPTETARQDLTLEVGGVRQTIDVTARPPLLNTESASVTTPINTRQIQELPQAIQDIDGLLFLAAGVGRAEFNSAPQIAGSTHWGGDNFTLNGVSVNDSANGGGSYSYDLGGVNLPALSSLQEVRIGGVNMDARYGRVVNVAMVTKNGTNQFHGDLYEYLENQRLNASDFILNRTNQTKPDFNRNQFGVDFGGPIVKNRTFFFFDYSAVRQSIPKTRQANFPSQAMRGGDFSAMCTGNGGTFDASGICSVAKQQLYNPFTGAAYANNIIPVGNQPGDVTPQALAIVQFMPALTDTSSLGLPNGGPNYTSVIAQRIHVNKFDVRIDEHLSDKDRVFGVYSYSVGDPWFDPPAAAVTSNFGSYENAGYKTFTLSLTEIHTFGSQTINSFRWAWFDHAGIRSGQNSQFDPYALFPQMLSSGNRGLPTIALTGYQNISDIGLAYYFPDYDIEITDDFTHVMGAHTLQAGIDETGFKVYVPQPNNLTPLPNWTFDGSWTGATGLPTITNTLGNAFADFLIGTATKASDGSPKTDKVLYDRDWQVYVQDIWQARRNLTLNFGLRYVYQTPWSTRDNQTSYYDPVNNAIALPQNSDTVTIPPGSVAALFGSPYNYPFETTQAAGLPIDGVYPDKNNFAPRIGVAWRPFGNGQTVLRGGFGLYYNYEASNIGPSHNPFNIPWAATYTYNSGKPKTPTSAYLPDLTFAQALPTGSTSVSGSTSNPQVRWMDSHFVNPRIKMWNITLERQFGNNWMGRATYVGNRTDHLTFYNVDMNVPSVQQLGVALQKQRPYQPWSQILTVNSNNLSRTDQLQLEAQHQFANGFFFQAQYSWTRCLDLGDPTGGPPDPSNPQANYGNCAFLRRHTFAANYIYELPFGHGRQWLQRGVLSQVLGDWNVSGITIYKTGQPFSVVFTVPASQTGWWGSISSGQVNRADLVPGVNPYIQDHSHEVGALWINPAAFAAPTPGTWGNSPRNGYFAPGNANWDISLMKDFHMPYREQHRLRVRADFFDAFNHYNFDNSPNVAVPDIANGGTANPNLGRILSGNDSRVIQLSLKYDF